MLGPSRDCRGSGEDVDADVDVVLVVVVVVVSAGIGGGGIAREGKVVNASREWRVVVLKLAVFACWHGEVLFWWAG